MPEAPTATAPSSASSGVRIVEAPPSKPAATPPGELRVGDIAKLPGEKREPLTSRESLRKNLESKAKPAGEPTTTPTEVKDPPAEADGATADKTGDKPAEGTQDAPEGTAAPKDGRVDKRKNPWKLFEEERKTRTSLEAEVQRLKSSVVPEQERSAIMARVEKAEARSKELENEIRFRAFEKSTEYIEQYQKPYEAAWKRATTELAEISITDPITQQPRGVTSEDILELVSLPLGKAREIADEVFGKFADDAMAHRKEIRGLFEKQNQAMATAREEGGARDQQQREAWQKSQSETSTFVQKSWKEANDSFTNDPENGRFFKPITIAEGKEATPEEQEWNESLERGYKLVDDAWATNVMDGKLTPEQRQGIIKKTAAVRARAAAFGPLKKLVKRHEARIKSLEKDLKEYTGSTPAAGGGGGERPAGGAKLTGMDGFREALRKKAH